MSKQIMIVDDDPGLLTLIELILTRNGFSVLKADGALKALSMLDRELPDLFILDLMLPDMNGFQLCEHIRNRPKTSATPIVILSARGDFKSQDESLKAGADRFLAKPVTRGDLINTVNEVLSLQERTNC